MLLWSAGNQKRLLAANDALTVAAKQWKNPPRGRLKCNVDALVFESENVTSWAAVVRDFGSCSVRNRSSSQLTEGIVMREALYHSLNWLVWMTLLREPTILRSANALNHKVFYNSKFELVDSGCLDTKRS
ncbi:hypothetical protein ES332_A13G211300v1 [Gossypium tomentosum]|uniref:RNase H type-1 domain-containing protein n=1 Tax=Gossypium tomentosum TaxID=34277 RepID=A0A5D2MN24_GOSTO|nr:hypothetical protein ES332_A13G211300v1 [Gossypium tomentosum]